MSKKQSIVDAAVILFAQRGYEATTTLHIARAAGVTEPLVYYHFRNKDGLFAEIITFISTEYFDRLDAIEKSGLKGFARIEALIASQFDLVSEWPAESNIFAATCPARFRDTAHVCTRAVEALRNRLATFIVNCLQDGITRGEFHRVPIAETAKLFIGMLIGLMRQEVIHPGSGVADLDITAATIEFCRRSLVKG